MGYADPKPAGRRLAALAAIGLLHLLFVYALVHGLARRIVEVVQPPVEVRIIEEVKPLPPEKPPTPAPKPLSTRRAAAAPAFVPQPEVSLPPPEPAPSITAVTPVVPTGPGTGTGTGSGAGAGSAGPGTGAAAPVRTAPVVRAESCETPSYPAASLRAGETGRVSLSFLIDVSGKVLESKVERSSGHARLDEAARNALELCRFKPGTLDGKPERAWARLQYEWKID
jgi:protein TonB